MIKDFIKIHIEESDEGYYLEKLYELQNGLPFLPERAEIEKK